MAIHPTHRIFPFCHPDYTLEWHEQEGKITAERIFSNGMRDQKRYPIKIPQLDPPINSSLPLHKVIKHLLRQSYVPAVSGKKVVWLSPGNSRVIEDLSQRIFSYSSSFSPSSSEREALKSPKIEVHNEHKFTFQAEVHAHNFYAGNTEKLIVHTPSFSLTEGIFNLPKPPPYFTGRKEILTELHALCQNNERVILSGLGGVGKTATVLQYAEEHKQEYSFIHFITGATFDLIMEGLLHLADHQKIPAGKPQERLELLKAHLNRFQKPFLLIFDGIDSPECFEQLAPLLPNRGHSLLVTSRLANQGEEEGFARIELFPFTEEEAIVYLCQTTGYLDKNQAALLAKELGYLPLALKHAAGYIKKNKQTSNCKDYLLLFEKHGVQLHDRKYLRLTAQEKTILTTWEISLTAIAQECELSIKLAYFLSCLAPAPIPKVLLEAWFKAFVNNSDLEFARALGYLEDYSLLNQTSQEICNIHVLVRKIIHFSLSQEESIRNLEEALQSLTPYSELDAQVPEKRASLTLFIPHFEKIFHSLKQETLSRNTRENLLQLAESIWSFDYYGGKYSEASKISQDRLEVVLAVYKKKSVLTANSYDALGLSLNALGKYKKALKYHKKTLETRKELLGHKHPDVATSLNNVGLVYGALGEYKEALKYQREALKMRQKLLGPKHPSVALCLNNVGATYRDLGEYEKALKHLREALEMRQKLLGPKHPDIAMSLNNVGVNYSDLGEHKEALKCHREALEMMRELLGPKHPDVATSLNNVGGSYGALGKHEKALKHKREALEMMRELLGPKHPDVATSLHSLGFTYVALGKHKEALKYQREALEMRQELLGPKHPDVVASLNNIGFCYRGLKKMDFALRSCKEALGLLKTLNISPNHPHVMQMTISIEILKGEAKAQAEQLISQAEKLRANNTGNELQLYEKALRILLELHDVKLPILPTPFLSLEIVKRLPLFDLCGKYRSV